MKSDYHAKQSARKERYEDLAEKNSDLSDSAYEQSRRIGDRIPLGQPILVGHHSESRHRGAIKKIDSAMRKSVETQKKAKYYERKAEGVGTGGISSDNPNAIAELTEQLTDAIELQEKMKRWNREYKKGGWDAVSDLSPAQKEKSKTLILESYQSGKPFESYQLTNNSANIRRIKKRIADLERAQSDLGRPDIIGEDFTVREDKEENRIMILFDGKPEAFVRTVLKKQGFKWSPSRLAWVRMLNNAGRYAADEIVKELTG